MFKFLKGLHFIVVYSGVKTGRCINDTGTCEIHAWCPVEHGQTPL